LNVSIADLTTAIHQHAGALEKLSTKHREAITEVQKVAQLLVQIEESGKKATAAITELANAGSDF
jgi:hypothetical protein